MHWAVTFSTLSMLHIVKTAVSYKNWQYILCALISWGLLLVITIPNLIISRSTFLLAFLRAHINGSCDSGSWPRQFSTLPLLEPAGSGKGVLSWYIFRSTLANFTVQVIVVLILLHLFLGKSIASYHINHVGWYIASRKLTSPCIVASEHGFGPLLPGQSAHWLKGPHVRYPFP